MRRSTQSLEPCPGAGVRGRDAVDTVVGLALERRGVVIQVPGRKGGDVEQVLQGRRMWAGMAEVPAEGFHFPSDGQSSSLLCPLPGISRAFCSLVDCSSVQSGRICWFYGRGMRLKGLGTCSGSHRVRIQTQSPASSSWFQPVIPPPTRTEVPA